MILRYVLLSCLFLMTFGCAKRYSEFSQYTDDGKVKASVALIPFVNNTSLNLSWNISEELTQGVQDSLLKRGNLFLSSEKQVLAIKNNLDNLNDLSLNLASLSQFSPNEFVVLLELLDHEELPYNRQAIKPIYPADGQIDYVLAIKARVKIIDIRSAEPKVILHEILRSNHMIPNLIAHISPEDHPYDSPRYSSTPLGIAHARLERDIALRLEEYIQIARSHQ